MCSFSVDDYCEVWRDSEQAARKEHRCSCCGARIFPGEKYGRLFTVFKGEASSDKECAPCRDSRLRFLAHHGSGMAPSNHPETLWECVDGADKRDPDAVEWRRDLAGIKRRGRRAHRESRLLAALVALNATSPSPEKEKKE